MITNFLLSILSAFVNGVVSFLPVGSLPTEISSALATMWGYVNLFSYVVAVDTLIQVVGLVLVFDLVVMAWHFINWIIRKIPGMQ